MKIVNGRFPFREVKTPVSNANRYHADWTRVPSVPTKLREISDVEGDEIVNRLEAVHKIPGAGASTSFFLIINSH